MLKRLKSQHLGSIVVAAILVVAAFVGASLAGAAGSGGVSASAVGCGSGVTGPSGSSGPSGASGPSGPSGPTGPPVPARVAVHSLGTWTLGTGQPGTPLPTFSYGARPLAPLMGDWNGDGVATVGTFQGGTFFLNDQNDGSGPEIQLTFGNPRGYPVAGDFDGNGCDDVAVYRNGTWQVHYFGAERPDDTFMLAAPFGQGSWPTTVPVAGDWDGDGIDGIGTYDSATATWVLKNTAGPGAPDFSPFVFGVPGSSYPVVGDWNGDGADSPGYRTGTTWTVRTSGVVTGPTTSFDFGPANAIPLTW